MSDDESVSDELWNEIESRLEDQSITFLSSTRVFCVF